MAASSSHYRARPRSQPSVASTSRTKSTQQIPLAKRLLFPTLATNELPPLLVSSSTPPELTAELYDFIALTLRAFVNPWWTKITRYDKEFLPEITRILSEAIRALEERVLAAKLSPLVFRDIPTIVTQHYCDYRNASSKLSTSYASGGAVSLAHLFHQLQPHMAVSADGRIDEEYFRQIVDHILKSCLPSEDYDPEAERVIIREIILKVVLNDIVPKVTQPWFIQKTILDFLDPSEDQLHPLKPPDDPTPPTTSISSSSFSFHTLLVVLLSVIQTLSGTCLAFIHAYKQAISTIKLVNQSPAKPNLRSLSDSTTTSAPLPDSPISRPRQHSSTISSVPPRHTLSPSHPSHSSTSSASSSVSSTSQSTTFPAASSLSPHPTIHEPNCDDFARAPLDMFAEVFTTHERFASSTIMSTLGMVAASMTPFLDRLLPHLLAMYLSPGFLVSITRTAKRTLFPNGYPAPPPLDPTPEEQAAIKEKLVAWRGKSGLSHLTPLILGPDPSATLAAAIDPLTSAPCNVHLLIMLLDRILVELFPELGGGGPVGVTG